MRDCIYISGKSVCAWPKGRMSVKKCSTPDELKLHWALRVSLRISYFSFSSSVAGRGVDASL